MSIVLCCGQRTRCCIATENACYIFLSDGKKYNLLVTEPHISPKSQMTYLNTGLENCVLHPWATCLPTLQWLQWCIAELLPMAHSLAVRAQAGFQREEEESAAV